MGRGESSSNVDMDMGSGIHRSIAVLDYQGRLCLPDAEEEPWHSTNDSHYSASSFDEVSRSPVSSCSQTADVQEFSGHLCISDCSVDSDLECVVVEVRTDPAKTAKDCRICHLSLYGTPEFGIPIELGCSCKHDLAAAHRQCAETWFKIKGNKICEICGATAKNILAPGDAETLEIENENNGNPQSAQTTIGPRGFWHGHRLLNFLLACMIFAFFISWMFHFNSPE